MDAADVRQALRAHHGSDDGSGQWVCIDEPFGGWHSGPGGPVDMLAIGAWATAKAPGFTRCGQKWTITEVADLEPDPFSASGWRREGGTELTKVQYDTRYPVVAYEIKTSRSDMRRELYGYQPSDSAKRGRFGRRKRGTRPWPNKARWALDRSHYFVFAVPKGMLTEEEKKLRFARADDLPEELRQKGKRALFVPPTIGLFEITEDGKVEATISARPTIARTWTPGEVAGLIRHAVQPNQLRKTQAELEQLKARVANQRGWVGAANL